MIFIGKLFVKFFLTIKTSKIHAMKKFTLLSLGLVTLGSLQSCAAIGDIFKAGMWWGIIVVVAVISLILWLFGKAKK